jgi:hypothetical protein
MQNESHIHYPADLLRTSKNMAGEEAPDPTVLKDLCGEKCVFMACLVRNFDRMTINVSKRHW